MRITTLHLTFCCICFLAACSKKGNSTDNPAPPPTTPPPVITPDPNAMRGVWLTTTASTVLDSKDNIRQAIQQCKQANINNIFVVVYNNARTIYPSAVMEALIGKPQLEKFSGRDPLQELITEAKASQIKVHAWFEYGFSSSYSASGGPIVAAKPEWAAKDADGKLAVKNGFDWLNGFHPEVQQFMLNLIKEVVIKYDVDGVQGDDRLPAQPSLAGYDSYTTALYQQEHNGASPPINIADAAWVNWRCGKLNQFAKKIYTEVKTIKPGIQITMSPSVYPFSKNEYLQDWPTWVDSGWVDAVIPQVYRYDITAYTSTASQQKQYFTNAKVKYYAGLLLRVGSYTAPQSFLTQMIQANRQNNFPGEVFFFYEGVKDRLSWFQGIYPGIK